MIRIPILTIVLCTLAIVAHFLAPLSTEACSFLVYLLLAREAGRDLTR